MWKEHEIQKVEVAFVGLCEVFNKEISEGLVAIYMKVFQSGTPKQALSAIDTVLMTCRFFPKPVDILEAMQGGMQERAARAWTILHETVCSISPGATITFEDPRISACVDFFGGWEEVCKWQTKDTQYRRAEFMKTYTSMIQEPPRKVHVGNIEHQNRIRGYLDKIPDPIVITNERRTQQALPPPPLQIEEEQTGPMVSVCTIKEQILGAFK